MAGVAGEALTRFGHEAGGDAVFAADGLDDVSGFIFSVAGQEVPCWCGDRWKTHLKRLALSAICLTSPYSSACGRSSAGATSAASLHARLTASKTPGPLSVCQPSMPQLNFSHASYMP